MNKTILFLGDGMADECVPALDGKTPMEYANTPAMDSIARDGVCGTMLTLPDGFPTSSEVANMSILGCDLATEYCGRGPLEAVGRNISLGPDDKAFRLNLTTVEGGILKDFSGGHIEKHYAEELIGVLNEMFGDEMIRFYTGVSYRNILVLSGPQYSHRVLLDKPDDNHGERVDAHFPTAQEPGAQLTADFLSLIMREAPGVLETCSANRDLVSAGKPMANGVWPWSGGKSGALRTLQEKYGISSAVISAVDVIVGLGRCLGMDVINVPGATGYTDTNYEGKADAAVQALDTHDFVYLHVEAMDEVSHAQDLARKIQAIEDFDSRVVGRVLSATDSTINVVVLPDHPVPVATGKHTRVPAPVAARLRDVDSDDVVAFSEVACMDGRLGHIANGDLMRLIAGSGEAALL